MGSSSRPQDHQQVAHRPRGVDERARLGAVGDAGGLQGVLEERERSTGGHEDRDVPEPARAPAVVALADDPALGERRGDDVRDVTALGGADDVGTTADRVGDGADHRHRRTDRADVPLGSEVDVVGLRGVRHLGVDRLLEEGSERDVHPVDDGRDGAEVRRELDGTAGLGCEAFACGDEHRDVGASEPVDGLLGVADDEEAPGGHLDVGPLSLAGRRRIGGGDAHGQLDLDRVGVLELVEEEPLVALVQRGPHDGSLHRVAQHPAGQHQQIVELEAPVLPTLVGGGERGGSEGGAEAVGAAVEHLAPDGLHGVAHGGELGEDLVLAALPRAGLAAAPAVPGEETEHLEQVEVVVAGGGEGRGEVDELVDRQQEVVGGVDALPAQSGEGRQLRVERGDEVGDARWLGAVLGDEVFHEVPRALEGEGEGAELGWIDVGGMEQQDGALEVGILEELVEDAGPPPVERDRGGHLVEHLHPGRELCLHRVLRQQPLRERVQRADRRPVELGHRLPAAVGLRAVVLRPVLEGAAEAVAQLGPGLLGEGDGGDVAELDRSRRDEGDDAVNQRRRLARASPRLHEQGGVQVGGDPIAGGLVGWSRSDEHDPTRFAQAV